MAVRTPFAHCSTWNTPRSRLDALPSSPLLLPLPLPPFRFRLSSSHLDILITSTHPDMLVRKGRRLSGPQEYFCRLIACEGKSQTAAYRLAFKANGHSAGDLGSRLMGKPAIVARVNQLRDMIDREAVLSATERRRILADMARTTVADLAGVDLGDAKALKRLGRKALAIKSLTTRTTPEGDTVASVQLVDRIAALREDAILAGERDTDKLLVQNNLQVNVNAVIGALTASAAVPALPANRTGSLAAASEAIAGDSSPSTASPPSHPLPLAKCPQSPVGQAAGSDSATAIEAEIVSVPAVVALAGPIWPQGGGGGLPTLAQGPLGAIL